MLTDWIFCSTVHLHTESDLTRPKRFSAGTTVCIFMCIYMCMCATICLCLMAFKHEFSLEKGWFFFFFTEKTGVHNAKKYENIYKTFWNRSCSIVQSSADHPDSQHSHIFAKIRLRCFCVAPHAWLKCLTIARTRGSVLLLALSLFWNHACW